MRTQNTHYNNQKKPKKQTESLSKLFIPKLPRLQQATSKKGVYIYNNNQTNQKPQPKPETNPKKQPEKTPVYTGQTNNNQEEPDG